MVLFLLTGIKRAGHTVNNNLFFDTLKITPKTKQADIHHRAIAKQINLRYYGDGDVSTGVRYQDNIVFKKTPKGHFMLTGNILFNICLRNK